MSNIERLWSIKSGTSCERVQLACPEVEMCGRGEAQTLPLLSPLLVGSNRMIALQQEQGVEFIRLQFSFN